MKKRIFALAVVMICLSILASTTLAYFTDTAMARNVVTSGGVDIAVEEWQETPNGLVPYPSQPIAVMPATSVSKIITVRSREAQCFIRAKLNFTLKDADGKEIELSVDAMDKIIHLAMNRSDWTEKNGWWYYGGTVDTDGVTKPLMTGVLFDGPNMTNAYQNCTVTIDVVAQAVQAANNAASALEAQGWPETE